MAGIKALRKLQLGKETLIAPGTAVAATTIWRGVGTIEDTRTRVKVVEDVGTYIPPAREYTSALGANLAMESVEATYEQLPYILNAAIASVVTGVADGVACKVYTFNFPEATMNTIRTFTIEGGDNMEAERMMYSYVNDFSLTGKGGEALMMSANWQGRQVALNAFTGALSIPTVEEILFSNGTLAIDAVTSAYGASVKSSTFLEMTFNYNTGWKPIWTGDGGTGLMYNFIKCVSPEITLDITFEHDATSMAEKVFWRANTPRLIQIKFTGTALAGATYSAKTLIFNLAGKWSKFSKLGEQDGNDIINATFTVGYDATKTDAGQIIVVNQNAALT
jgi:hypothetical protein